MTEYRKAMIYVNDIFAGILEEYDGGYRFQYDSEYLGRETPSAVSLTLPLRSEPYQSGTLFPFFDGLIPEGWLLDISVQNWKLDPRDRMGLLMTCCRDCIGAVSVEPFEE
jgi:serine/threonine-protein kinase HipA